MWLSHGAAPSPAKSFRPLSVERVGIEVVVVREVERFVGEAVAREVERDGSVGLAELGEDVAVEVVAGWEAVEEEDWGGTFGSGVPDSR